MQLIQVGLGGFGRSWATLCRAAAGVELVAVADSDAGARGWAATELGLPAAAIRRSLDDALAGSPDAAVLVATPPDTHHAVAVAALRAGRHVLLEKPLATSMDDARALVASADRAGRVLMVSQNYRFRRPARAMQRLVAEGAIGGLAAVTIRFRRDSRALWPPDNFRYLMRHPLLLDMGIHHADLLRAVTGQEVRSVYARGWRVPDSPYRHDPAAVAVMELAGGATVVYEGDWATGDRDTSWNGEWELLGEDGRLRWTGGENDALAGTILLQRRGEATLEVPLPDLNYVDRAGTLDAFRAAVDTGTEPETSARDNVGSLGIVLGCVASIARGEAVALAEAAGW